MAVSLPGKIRYCQVNISAEAIAKCKIRRYQSCLIFNHMKVMQQKIFGVGVGLTISYGEFMKMIAIMEKNEFGK